MITLSKCKKNEEANKKVIFAANELLLFIAVSVDEMDEKIKHHSAFALRII